MTLFDPIHYSINELNDIIQNKLNISINELPCLQLKGEIVECKFFKNNSGMSFKITHNNYTFNCKAWSNKINIQLIKELENKTCIVVGYIKQNYFLSKYDFVLELTKDIVKENNDSKIQTLKNECTLKNYFSIKKKINWNKIQKIGIISKKETQGYNDFIQQFTVPLDLVLEEIILEGTNTEQSLITAIHNLNTNYSDISIILIMRGGGSTFDISNSFDTLPIFDAIKNSTIPIITAIGHEADKNDKLLITTVSDFNFSTPSTAALELTTILLEPIFQHINTNITTLKTLFNKLTSNNTFDEYTNLKNNIETYFKIILGGQIISIEDNIDSIIIFKNNEYYKLNICLDTKLIINKDLLDSKHVIDHGVETNNIEIIESTFKKLYTKRTELITTIHKNITCIKTNDTFINKFNNCIPKKYHLLYCKPFVLNTELSLTKIIQLYSLHLWYLQILNDTSSEYSKDIYTFFNSFSIVI